MYLGCFWWLVLQTHQYQSETGSVCWQELNAAFNNNKIFSLFEKKIQKQIIEIYRYIFNIIDLFKENIYIYLLDLIIHL